MICFGLCRPFFFSLRFKRRAKDHLGNKSMPIIYWIFLTLVLLAAFGVYLYFESEKRRLLAQFRDSIKDVALNAGMLTAKAVDLKKYAGKWFEIARLPNWFQSDADCRCTTATYTALDSGQIDVLNECGPTLANQKLQSGRAIAQNWLAKSNQSKSENAALRVNFLPRFLTGQSEWLNLIFGGDYWILDVDEKYNTAIVGSPDYSALWFLSRTATLASTEIDRMKKIAKSKGYDVEKLLYSKCVEADAK